MSEHESQNFEQQYNNYFESGGQESVAAQVESQDGESEVDNGLQEMQTQAHENDSYDETGQEQDSGQDFSSDEPGNEPDQSKQEEIDNNLKIALKQERTKRQELEREYKDAMTQLQSESRQTREALAALLNPQQQEQVPSYDDDPLGYMKWQNDQLTQKFQQQQQYIEQQTQTQQAYQQVTQLNNDYIAQKNELAKSNPDIDSAAEFLQESVINEYRALGYPEQQAQQLLLQDKISLLANAKEKGINSAQLVMEVAKARGYRPSGQQSPQDKLKNVRNGQAKSKSLSGSTGSNINNNTTLTDLARMDDKQFENLWKQYETGNLQL